MQLLFERLFIYFRGFPYLLLTLWKYQEILFDLFWLVKWKGHRWLELGYSGKILSEHLVSFMYFMSSYGLWYNPSRDIYVRMLSPSVVSNSLQPHRL